MATEIRTLRAEFDTASANANADTLADKLRKTGDSAKAFGEATTTATRNVAQSMQDASEKGKTWLESVQKEVTDFAGSVKQASESGGNSIIVLAGKFGVLGVAAAAGYKLATYGIDKFREALERSNQEARESLKRAIELRDLSYTVGSDSALQAAKAATTRSVAPREEAQAGAYVLAKAGDLDLLRAIEGASIVAGKSVEKVASAWEELRAELRKGDSDDQAGAIRKLQEMNVFGDAARNKIEALGNSEAERAKKLEIARSAMQEYTIVAERQAQVNERSEGLFARALNVLSDYKSALSSGFDRGFGSDVDSTNESVRTWNTLAENAIYSLQQLNPWIYRTGAAFGVMAQGVKDTVQAVSDLVSWLERLPGSLLDRLTTAGPGAVDPRKLLEDLEIGSRSTVERGVSYHGYSTDKDWFTKAPRDWRGAAVQGPLGTDETANRLPAVNARKAADDSSGSSGSGGRDIRTDSDLVARYRKEIEYLAQALDAGTVSQTEFDNRRATLQANLAKNLDDPQRYAEDVGAFRAAYAEKKKILDRWKEDVDIGAVSVADAFRYGAAKASAEWGSFTKQIADSTGKLLDSFASGFSDAFSAFITGSKSAGAAFGDFARSFLNDIVKMIAKAFTLYLLQQAIGFFVPGAGPVSFGGALSAAVGLPVRHSGGLVDGSGPFAMPRFHTGGIVGERPILAKDGEGVFTAAQMRALAPVSRTGGAGVSIGSIQVDARGNASSPDGSAAIVAALVRKLPSFVREVLADEMRERGMLSPAAAR